MTADGLSIISWYFINFFRFFTDWHIPGTNVSPAMWLIFLAISVFVFEFIKGFLTSVFGGD